MIPSGARKARPKRPKVPFVLNSDSPQALGLLDYYVGDSGFDMRTAIKKYPLTVKTAGPTSRAFPFGEPICSNLPYGDGAALAGVQRSTGTVPAYVATTDSVTFACWFYMDRNNADNHNWGLFQLGVNGGAWSMSGSIPSYTSTFNGAVVTTSGGATRNNVTSGHSYAPFVWHHYCLVWNAGVALTLYVDGVADGSTSIATTTMRDVSEWQIGYANPGSLDLGEFAGTLTNACLYGRALSAREVWALYDPQTRWDLYWQPSRKVYVHKPSAVVSRRNRLPLLGVS